MLKLIIRQQKYPLKIKFEYIKGIKNTLADTRSCLIKIVPDTKTPPEPEGYEFGYYAFEELDLIKTEKDKEIIVIFNREVTRQS